MVEDYFLRKINRFICHLVKILLLIGTDFDTDFGINFLI